MRTNAIDALAFRCHAEYKVLMEILYNLEEDTMEGHAEEVCNHWTAMSKSNNLNDIRTAHSNAMNEVTKAIRDATEALKTKAREITN